MLERRISKTHTGNKHLILKKYSRIFKTQKDAIHIV